ncbi:MAG: efflux RND transporter permease subunit, partial [Pseudomonadota bacterium]
MRLSHFFIDRPIFASVVSILLVIVGAISFLGLPVSQYPEVAPPTIQVSAVYPGASAEVVANTVATPLEQEINGVDGMIYMSSQSTADGRSTITITFEIGTDLDAAQVLVQNRVAIAEPRLPEPVRRLGVTTSKNSPDLMMVVHLNSPDGTFDQLYISNYTLLQIRDVIARVDGVGSISVFGARQYSMRVWLDPDRLTLLGLTPGEVVAALRSQNLQVASGTLNQEPMPNAGAFEFSVQTLGRLTEASQFNDVVVKTSDDGRVVRLRDVARVEIGAQDYVTNSYLDDRPAVAMVVFQQPGTNALETAGRVLGEMERLEKEFPDGFAYSVVYNPTEFISQSINEVYRTIAEAALLVVLVIFIFLQSLRAALIPIIAIPVSLIGTFAIMAALGFSLNNLSLFGLVLAIGIVVDDAIVVVENVERNLREGLPPREAARTSMDEVGGALIATSLVLIAVFVPTAFLGGVSGLFFQQFGVTIAVATAISTLVSLTLSPAMAALFLRLPQDHLKGEKLPFWKRPLNAFFSAFNKGFDALNAAYGALVARLVRASLVVLVVYGSMLAVTGYLFQRTPTGFVPAQDQGYFIVAIQLPPGASLSRTDAVTREVIETVRQIDGVEHGVGFAGFSGATFTNASNAGVVFTPLAPFAERQAQGITYFGILSTLRQQLAAIEEAFILVIPPPPVRGIGTGGGFKMMVQDRANRGLATLQEATQSLSFAANSTPGLTQVFSTFEVSTPQIYADIDRVRAEMLGVPVANVFEALEIYL